MRRLAALLLLVLLLGLALIGAVQAGDGGGRVTSGVLTAPPKGVLPGRQAVTATPGANGWRVTGGVELRRREDGTWRLDLDLWLRPQDGPPENVTPGPTATPTTPAAATNTPAMTSTPFPTNTPRPTDTPPSPTPATVEPPTPTPEEACVVRSTANVNARTLPVVRSDTVIGLLPAGSPVRITGYYVEQVSATVSYIWYRYWYDVEHPEAWSRADFFTARDDTPGCQLLPRVTEP